MALNIEEIIASVKEATVLELNELSKSNRRRIWRNCCCSCSCSWRVLQVVLLKKKLNLILFLLGRRSKNQSYQSGS